MNAPSQFTHKRQLTLPTIKFDKGEPRYLKFEEKIRAGSVIKGSGERAKESAAQLVVVTDLVSGQRAQLTVVPSVGAVLKSSYPDDSYVGLCFEITKHNRREQKGMPDFSVTEVDQPKAQQKR